MEDVDVKSVILKLKPKVFKKILIYSFNTYLLSTYNVPGCRIPSGKKLTYGAWRGSPAWNQMMLIVPFWSGSRSLTDLSGHPCDPKP